MTRDAASDFQRFQQYLPDQAARFRSLCESVAGSGDVDAKTKQLSYLAALGAVRAEASVRAHAGMALKLGATPGQILESLALVIPAAGLSAFLAVLPTALEAIDRSR